MRAAAAAARYRFTVPRSLRATLVGAALLVLGAAASTAGAASFAYDAGTQLLTLSGGTGENIHIETTDTGQYSVSATVCDGCTVPWSGTNRAGIYAWAGGGQYGLTVQSASSGQAGTVPLSGIKVVDDTGPVTVSIGGGSNPVTQQTQPYLDPLAVVLNNAGSQVRIERWNGEHISFGSTTLNVTAPSILMMNSIEAADTVWLRSTMSPILLGNGGSEPAAKSITATTRLLTSAIDGNGKDLTVHGPWRTDGVSGAREIRALDAVSARGDLSATNLIELGDLAVTSGAYPARTITAPAIALQGTVQQQVGCADAEITCGAFGAAGGPGAAGAGLKLDGAVTAHGRWSSMGNIEVTGPIHLSADIADLWFALFDDRVYLSGAATRTIQADFVKAREGIEAESTCGAGSIDGLSVCSAGIASAPLPTSNLVIDGEFSMKGTTYMPGDITLRGHTSALGDNGVTNLQAGGTLNVAGGLSVPPTGSAFLTGAPTILAGMPAQVGNGSIDAADACDAGPVTVTGNLRVTAPIECVGSLSTVLGAVTLAADVTSDRFQSYAGPTTIALGSAGVRLRSQGGAEVNFPEAGVSAAWDAADGDIASYTATAQPSGTSCTWTSGPLTCSLGAIPSASDMRFSLTSTPRPPAAGSPKAGTEAPLPTGRTTRRTVARGSRTPLTRLIVPPVSRGARRWSERGPCSIRAGRLVAPNRAGTCTVALRVARYRRTPPWTGRATVTVR